VATDVRTVNRFRRRRGARLAAWLTDRADDAGRPVTILDVGGRPQYWDNVLGGAGTDALRDRVQRIVVCNVKPTEFDFTSRRFRFEELVGDATALGGVGDREFDVYHANSVIEHVGDWAAMVRMATEARRVAAAGWVQTPAWEFPVEPHLRQPFVHWLAAPARRRFMRTPPWTKDRSLGGRRTYVENINLVSRPEFEALFPGTAIWTERFAALPKSYVATWDAPVA